MTRYNLENKSENCNAELNSQNIGLGVAVTLIRVKREGGREGGFVGQEGGVGGLNDDSGIKFYNSKIKYIISWLTINIIPLIYNIKHHHRPIWLKSLLIN